jgi:imidazolonepropionase
MTMNVWDSVWLNAHIVTMELNGPPFGLIKDGAIGVKDGKIVWVGSVLSLPGQPSELAIKVHDVAGHCITPGFIDCHTHLVYGGNRCHEFEMRLQGMSYAAIAEAGGGIQATVAATRAVSEEELFAQSFRRAKRLVSEGVTTLEIKSGYGLDVSTELKILRVAKRLGEVLPVHIVLTFLGAHALPPEYANRADDYIDLVCNTMLPAVMAAGLVDAVDVFCETMAFNLEQTARVFAAAQKLGLPVKCHAEQLSDSGAACLAATQYAALSVDHLEYLSAANVMALAKTNTVAVLLPGAFYYLREKTQPPVHLLREHGVPMAIATDCNPGTSPVTSILLMLNMACTLFGLTPEEALAGVTRNAAQALELADTRGTLTVGKKADFAVWDIEHPAELTYNVGLNSLVTTVFS